MHAMNKFMWQPENECHLKSSYLHWQLRFHLFLPPVSSSFKYYLQMGLMNLRQGSILYHPKEALGKIRMMCRANWPRSEIVEWGHGALRDSVRLNPYVLLRLHDRRWLSVSPRTTTAMGAPEKQKNSDTSNFLNRRRIHIFQWKLILWPFKSLPFSFTQIDIYYKCVDVAFLFWHQKTSGKLQSALKHLKRGKRKLSEGMLYISTSVTSLKVFRAKCLHVHYSQRAFKYVVN